MAIVDDALARLRQHAVDLGALSHSLRMLFEESTPDLLPIADRLDKAGRDAADDVETLRILSYAHTPAQDTPRPMVTAASQPEPDVAPQQPVNPRLDALFEESMAAHDRDYAQRKNGLPKHRAGELPERCEACALFAVLNVPNPTPDQGRSP